MYKRWFLSQVGKAIDCNSMTVGSNPTGTSIQEIEKVIKNYLQFILLSCILYKRCANSSTGQSVRLRIWRLRVRFLLSAPFTGKQHSLVVHLFWEQGVAGSNPVFPTICCLQKALPSVVNIHGAVAHLGERLICIQEVESSILFSSTMI